MAQSVTGTVVDTENNPLIGVNVVESGTTNGTITDIDGIYSIELTTSDASLSFSFIGYETQTIQVVGRDEINVQMEPSAELLEDVVVIGYGTVKKEDLTGAVAVVSSEDLNKTPIPDIGKAMQGRATGVTVMQSGDPSGSVTSGYGVSVQSPAILTRLLSLME